jgi:23S rRNA (guanosine2251-2'-O)-methyltransferase
MSGFTFEIRLCTSCGLRYPIMQEHAFGIRCPQCLGETRVVVAKSVIEENKARERNKTNRNSRFVVLLDNIRSAWNVGSILRSADGFGFDHAYLCGITPTPENEAVRKTSLGAEDYVAWSHRKDAVKLIEDLKLEGWKVCALEENERSKPLAAGIRENRNTALIVGSEVTGVDPEIFFIPMSGGKRSFNAAIAFGIAAFALVEQQG